MRLPRFARQTAVLACALVALAAAPATEGFGPTLVQSAHAQASASPVTAPIEGLDEALLTIMREGRQASFRQRYDAVAAAVDRALDIPFILRISVGLNWSSMSAQQQQQLLGAFRDYTIASYVDNFDDYDGQTIRFCPTRGSLRPESKWYRRKSSRVQESRIGWIT